jgi:hypothetical protein
MTKVGVRATFSFGETGVVIIDVKALLKKLHEPV